MLLLCTSNNSSKSIFMSNFFIKENDFMCLQLSRKNSNCGCKKYMYPQCNYVRFLRRVAGKDQMKDGETKSVRPV